MQTTGLDPVDVSLYFKPGTTIAKIDYVTPSHYGFASTGRHETYEDALLAGLVKAREQAALPGTTYQGQFCVDTRFHLQQADGGAVDVIGSRTSYEDLADAERHLVLLRKFPLASKAV